MESEKNIEPAIVQIPDLSFGGNYRKVFRQALEYCDIWHNSIQKSPALDMRTVELSKKAVKYLAYKSKTTSNLDALNRLKHIPNAKNIIESSVSLFEREVASGEIIKYGLIGQIQGGRLLKVIILENTRHNKLTIQTIYEVNRNIELALGPYLKTEDFNSLAEKLARPIYGTDLTVARNVVGRVVLLGQISERKYNLLIFTGSEFTLVKLQNTQIPKLTMGSVIEISSRFGLVNKNGIKNGY